MRHFCYLLRPALGDDATKVMVSSETKQPESLRDARDLWSVVTTTFYYFLSSAVYFKHTRARAQREGRKVEARLPCRAMREMISGRYREVIPLRRREVN